MGRGVDCIVRSLSMRFAWLTTSHEADPFSGRRYQAIAFVPCSTAADLDSNFVYVERDNASVILLRLMPDLASVTARARAALVLQ